MNSKVKISPATQYMRSNMCNGELTPTKTTGNKFDGVIQDADVIGNRVTGHIFGATPRFEDGTFIETSEVVRVSNILSAGWFVETVSGSRYLISSVNFNPTLPSMTKSVEAALKHCKHFIEINQAYFKPLQWS